VDVKQASIHTLIDELKQRTVSMIIEAQGEGDVESEQKLRAIFTALKHAEWSLMEYAGEE
jgi:hypothetical protein